MDREHEEWAFALSALLLVLLGGALYFALNSYLGFAVCAAAAFCLTDHPRSISLRIGLALFVLLAVVFASTARYVDAFAAAVLALQRAMTLWKVKGDGA